jgi:hypothetical protein
MAAKIGIITFHRALNYGAVLQAYALPQFINSLESSAKAQLIDYRSGYFEKLRHGIYGEDILKSIARSIVYFIPVMKRRRSFNQFLKNIPLSKKVNEKSIRTTNEWYNVFFTGSDQVFNLDCSGNDAHYFLDFVSLGNMKNSYAASIGKAEISSEMSEYYKNHLNSFDVISIREKEGANSLQRILPDKDVRIDYDPVFLLSASEWQVISNSKCIHKWKIEKPFLFLYCVFYDEKLFDYAVKFAQESNLDVVACGIPPSKAKTRGNIKILNEIGPAEWLSLMVNSAYVLTNSFHGVSFSFIFNKNFKVAMPSGSVGSKLTSRIGNLVELFDASSCQLEASDDGYQTLIKDKRLSFDYVNAKIEDIKKSEKEFLLSIINKIN